MSRGPIYSNKDILDAVKIGEIICMPFNSDCIAEASLDITLGRYYYKQESTDESRIYNPFDEDDVTRYFKGPMEAEIHAEWAERNGRKLFKNIPPDHPIIVLAPGERILGHTHEFIGVRGNGAASVSSRSSWGRNGVAVCFDAGWIDPGYINRLTLEIYNLNKSESVVLPVGERMAQLIFYTTGEVDGSYNDGRGGISGKYASSDDLGEIIKQWRPQMMLPRAFKDSRKMPAIIDGLTNDLL